MRTMAERRMFAKTIIDSDAFLDMSLSAQALYFHLAMRADDDGFVNNPKKIQRMIGCNDDDVKILIAKRFIIPFDSGVCVIKHWLIHNLIRKDRYKETAYIAEKRTLSIAENGAYENSGIPLVNQVETVGIPSDNQRLTQDRLGKVRLGKDRIGEERIGESEGEIIDINPQDQEPPDDERPGPSHLSVPYEQIKSLYNQICLSFPKCTTMSDARRKAIRARFASGYTLEDFKTLFTKAEFSSFMRGSNSRNWMPTFDWLIKDGNMAKVLDGNYDDHPVPAPGPGPGGPPSTGNVFLDMLRAEEAKGDGDHE